MSSTNTDLIDLTAALRKALRSGSATDQPVLDTAWRTRWPVLGELGVTALCVAEDRGGFGADVPAALVAARELGAALHGSPYAAVVAAGYALSRSPDAAAGEPVDAIVSGTRLPALAFLAPGATVRATGAGRVVDGHAYLVAGADDADVFLALVPGDDTMLLVHRADTCVVVRAHDFDVTRSCADLAFHAADAVPVAAPGARATVELLYGLLLVGDTLGGLARMLDRTVDYARGRTAFGKAIGGFQAVQHRLADHTVRLRGMTLLAEHAAARLADDAPDAARAVRLAEASVASGAVPMLHDLVQLTGAIGFTWEYGLHLYERRAHLSARLGGNPRRALRSLAELAGWTQAVA